MTARTLYLAGPYSARENIAAAASELRTIGYTVRAEWLTGEHDFPAGAMADTAVAKAEREKHERSCALLDFRDIDAADMVVAFTAQSCMPSMPGIRPLVVGTSGGRHVETGYALAQGKTVVLVGQPENVFHQHPRVKVCPSWHVAVLHLAGLLVEHERNVPQLATAVAR